MSVDPRPFVKGTKTLSEALTRLANFISPNEEILLFYGFYVHMQSAGENDFIIEFSHPDIFRRHDVERVYFEAGGTSTDMIAPNVPNMTVPVLLNIPALAQQFREDGDSKHISMDFLVSAGIKSCWVAPINAPWSGGYGVLNHMTFEEDGMPLLDPTELIPLAHDFHDAVRKEGLLAKRLGLTNVERRTLSLLATGKTAKQIAPHESVSERAVERRIERARAKLKARNTSEAIYKGMAYGALPLR